MASVAADPSAIAPPMPLPSRSDAAPPAGPSSAFADLLGAAAATPPQPQSGSSAPTSDGSNAPTGGIGSSDPAGAAAADSGSGINAAGNSTGDPATALDAGAATLDLTLVAGLLLPSVPAAASADAEQTANATDDPQDASGDATSAIGGDTSGKPDDHKDAISSSDPVAAAILGAVPIFIPIAVPAAVVASASDSRTAFISSVTALPSGPMFSAPDIGAPAADADVASSGASVPTDQAAQPIPKWAAAAQDALAAEPALAAALAPTDGLPSVPPGALTAGATGTADPSGTTTSAAPAVATPAPPSGPSISLVTLAQFNPAPPSPLSAETHVADQPVGSTETPAGAEGTPVPLPAQVAVRFASSVHADDDNPSDNGTGGLWGSAGHNASPAAITSNGAAGTAMPGSFNASLVQAVSAPATTSPHTTVAPDAVPLAGIPIAIVARAEAGEKKFEIRLDPPDLGRIEVQLNVDSSGRATSHLIVDRADTLDLLRRDAPALERALQSAGLTTGDGALQFSLRDQSFAGRDQGSPTVTAPVAAPADSDPAPIDAVLRRYGALMGLGGGIDIRV